MQDMTVLSIGPASISDTRGVACPTFFNDVMLFPENGIGPGSRLTNDAFSGCRERTPTKETIRKRRGKEFVGGACW